MSSPKASLNHWGFDWDKDYGVIWRELKQKWPDIASVLDVAEWFGVQIPDDPAADWDELEPFTELAEMLGQAAATRIDFGRKPARNVIATIRAVEKNPELVFSAVESEALVEIERHFSSGSEPTEMFSLARHDALVGKHSARAILTHEAIKAACRRAVVSLKAEAKRGRPTDLAVTNLADQLASWLRKNGLKPTIINKKSYGESGQEKHPATGDLIEFAKLIIEPANKVLERAGANTLEGRTLAEKVADKLTGN